MREYAKMDIQMAKSKRGIGESSNLAQLALTYYWTDRNNNYNTTFTTKNLHDNFIILAVLAQVIIDSSKRSYEVDALDEIERIKAMECMNPTDIYGNKKDFPEFMKYTKDIPVTKNGNPLEYEIVKENKAKVAKRINYKLVCPMNWLQGCLNRIQGMPKTNTTPVEDFFIRKTGIGSYKYSNKVIKLAEEFDAYTKSSWFKMEDQNFWHEYTEAAAAFYEKVSKIKTKNEIAMNRLIEASLGIEKTVNLSANRSEAKILCRKILNALFRTDRQKFLSNFVENQ